MGSVGQLEVLDRDGQVRQSFAVAHWPLHIGRALTNDVVLSDPHVAAEHFSVEPDAQGLSLAVAHSRNGVLLGGKRLREGERAPLAPTGEPIELTAGRTRLRLRLPGHTLAPELALAPVASLARRLGPVLGAAALLVLGLLFKTYLDTDPDEFARAAGSALLAAFVGGAVWCGAWALLSKTFTRQAHFGWHLRVFLFASLALLVVNVLPALVAFALSWPWLSDFAFGGDIAVAATALYFHLLAVEPARQRALKWVALSCAFVAVALTLWFNVQRTDQPGDELYMNHLFPPALRLARPATPEAFVNGLESLKSTLDKKAQEPGRGDDDAMGDDD
jgi:Inner membrane component of T3SS, cytoplasmic domain